MLGYCRSLKHLKTGRLNHGAEFLNKQPKRRRPDADYEACLICQNGADCHSRPIQKLTDQGYLALLYAITNRKDDISFRIQNDVDPHSDFLEKNPVGLARYRSKYTNRKTVEQRKSKYAK